jgi:hypothetical protein
MGLLLIIGFIIPFVFLGYFIIRLDRFLAKNAMVIDDDAILPGAIVLGRNELAMRIIDLLERDRIQVIHLTEPFMFKREQNLRYLFALSENDADNIVLCKIGKKTYDIEEMISICNDRRNERMFVSEKIHYLLSEKLTAQVLYKIVVKETEMKL